MDYRTKFEHPNTSLPITDEEWEEFKGEKVLLLPKNELSSLKKIFKTKEEVLDSRVWNFHARDPKILLSYLDFISPLMGKPVGVGILPFQIFGRTSGNSLNTLSLTAPMQFSGITENDLFNGTNTFIGVKTT